MFAVTGAPSAARSWAALDGAANLASLVHGRWHLHSEALCRTVGRATAARRQHHSSAQRHTAPCAASAVNPHCTAARRCPLARDSTSTVTSSRQPCLCAPVPTSPSPPPLLLAPPALPGLLYAGSLWLSNSAYLYLSVSFIQMTKSLMPGLVYASGVMLGTEKYSRGVTLNMLLIAFGVVICAIGEMNLVFRGVVQQLTALGFEVRGRRTGLAGGVKGRVARRGGQRLHRKRGMKHVAAARGKGYC